MDNNLPQLMLFSHCLNSVTKEEINLLRLYCYWRLDLFFNLYPPCCLANNLNSLLIPMDIIVMLKAMTCKFENFKMSPPFGIFSYISTRFLTICLQGLKKNANIAYKLCISKNTQLLFANCYCDMVKI